MVFLLLGVHVMRRWGSKATRRGLTALLVVGFAFACVMASGSAAEDINALEKILPADTMLYVSFKNPGEQVAFHESAIYKIAQEPEMKAFLANVEDELRGLHARHAAEVPVDIGLIEEALGDEISFAFTGLRQADESSPPQPGIIISTVFQRAPEDAEQALLAGLRAASGGAVGDAQPAFDHQGVSVKSVGTPDVTFYYTFLGKRLIAASAEADLRAMLDLAQAAGRSLAEDAMFKKTMSKMGGSDAMVRLYVNAQLLTNLMRVSMPPQQSGVLDTLGLYNIQALGLASRFADGGIRDSFYIYAPGERTGILPQAGNPVDLSMLSCVPDNAEMVSLTRLDIEQLYGTVMRAIAQAAPEEQGRIAGAIAAAEEQVGFKIQEDLLASLGTQILIFQAPRETVFMVEVKDRAKLDSCIESLVAFGAGKVEKRELEYEGTTIRHVNITGLPLPLTPSYTYYRNFLVVGLYPQTLKSFVARVKAKSPSITDSEDFQRVSGQYLKGCDAISYSNVAGKLTDCYDLVVILAQMLHGVSEVSIRPELMPHGSAIEPHMFGLGSGTLNDAEGILTESFSPVGSAGGLLAALGSIRSAYGLYTQNLAAIGIMGGMMMPALVHARGGAQRAACLANLRNISLGIAMYETDYNDQWPETLQDVFQYMPAPQVFVCPNDPQPMIIPDSLKHRERFPEGGLKCSYHYVGRLSAPVEPMTIILYEKSGNHEDGRTVAFGDLHAERLDEDTFQAYMQESLRLVKEADWDGYSDERKAEIEAFYAQRQ